VAKARNEFFDRKGHTDTAFQTAKHAKHANNEREFFSHAEVAKGATDFLPQMNTDETQILKPSFAQKLRRAGRKDRKEHKRAKSEIEDEDDSPGSVSARVHAIDA
jgi:hypothetical protein